jgi:Glycosyltransferase family 87
VRQTVRLRRFLSPPAPLAWVIGFALVTTLLVWTGRVLIPAGKACPDYICYWAAGENLLAGRSPYDVAAQTRVQHALGWDRAKNGLGIYEFLPYYYPPWFAMLCAAFIPLGYETARIAWLTVNAELVVLTAYLLRNIVPGVPRSVPLAVVPLFIFTIAAVIVGQTTSLVFFLIVVAWRLLEAGRDLPAGAVLAWVTIKPQLTAVLLLAVLLWAIRRGRWSVVQGFAAMLAILCLASFLVLPMWLGEMLDATRRTPPPTEHFPWIGATWYLVLKGAGLRSWALNVAYLIVSLAYLGVVLRVAIDRSTPLRDVLSLSLLAAYFVAPYGRHYDFPVLLIAFLVLLGTRLSERWGTALLLTLLLLPYLHYMVLDRMRIWLGLTGRLNPEFTFFWVPLLLTMAWLCSRPRTPHHGAAPA